MNKEQIMALSEKELLDRAGVLLGKVDAYTTSMAAAWELVEFLQRELGAEVAIQRGPVGTVWTVLFALRVKKHAEEEEPYPFFLAQEKTAPLAITRAFVLMMEGLNESE